MIQPEAIPAEIRCLARWVLWRYEERDGKPTKVPYSVQSGRPASTTDAATWAPFDAAWNSYNNGGAWSGIGFVFSPEDDILGVDLDHCRDPETGHIEEWAEKIMLSLSSYAEVTPSETGIHILCRGHLQGARRRHGPFEVYEEGRYFTVTGAALQNRGIEPREAELAAVCREMLPAPAGPRQSAAAVPILTGPDLWSVIEKVLRHPKGGGLWRGDVSGHESHSEADAALCEIIAWFAGPDPVLIDQVFRQSALYRPERWDRSGDSYSERTIQFVLADKAPGSFYQWRGASPRPPAAAAKAEEASVASGASGASVTLFQPPKALEPEAFYGLPGMAVELILPHTEADAAALMANFLTAAGCMIGPHPYIYRDGRRQGTNEFACVVGLSAASRKGTATSRVEEILKNVIGSNNTSQYDIYEDVSCMRARAWEELVIRGLGSGEALVSSLAEGAKEEEPDGRRFVFEEEFSRCLKVMSREGSTLSEMLRAAWDGSRIENRVKGKTLTAPPGHVALMGHITEMEMRLRLSNVELFNGFANRFLWFSATRSKYLPLGGGHPPTSPVVIALRLALARAKLLGEMRFDARVEALWDGGGIYKALENRPPGLLGSVTARAAAHVTRLALLWAVLDGEEAVRVPHLMAALAVWDYSEKTCAYLFGRSTGDDYADAILEFLEEVSPGFLTRTEIRDRFKRHAEAGRIMQALGLLERQELIEKSQIPGAGRWAECWARKTVDDGARSAGCDISPLERARSLIR